MSGLGINQYVEYEIPYSDKPNSKWIIYKRLVNQWENLPILGLRFIKHL